jgi:phosphatidylserine decarboxylase
MQKLGLARKSAKRIISWTLVILLAILGGALCAVVVGTFIAGMTTVLIAVWVIFALFTLYFFRDPTPNTPAQKDVIVAPAHGTVDIIDETEEKTFIGGKCKRVSIFLSIFDVHVQNAPVAGVIKLVEYTPGEFKNAMDKDSSLANENVLIGIESTETPGEKIGVRQIAGLIARRVVPWVSPGDTVARGERLGIIQFGSRCDLYIPQYYDVVVNIGTKVKGGETIIAQKNFHNV